MKNELVKRILNVLILKGIRIDYAKIKTIITNIFIIESLSIFQI
jgi:hypothetical protein